MSRVFSANNNWMKGKLPGQKQMCLGYIPFKRLKPKKLPGQDASDQSMKYAGGSTENSSFYKIHIYIHIII